MKYQIGKMGIAEGLAIVFIMTFARVFLSTPLNFLITGKNTAWFAQLAAGGISLTMFYILIYVMGKVGGDLLEVCQKLLGKIIAGLIAIYLIVLFFLNAASLLRQFAENTLLTALPFSEFHIILLIYTITVIAISWAGIEGMARATYLIMPFGIVGMLLVLVMLYPYYDIDCVYPLLGSGPKDLLIGSLQATGVNFAVVIIAVIAPSLHTSTGVRAAAAYGLGISTIVRAISVLVFIMVFDVAVGAEKVLPFYEMARLIFLGQYLQHLESLFILLWVIVGVLAVAISIWCGCYLQARLFNLPSLRPIIPVASAIIMGLSALPPDVGTVIQLDMLLIKTAFNGAIFVIPVVLAAAYFLVRRKEVTKCASTK